LKTFPAQSPGSNDNHVQSKSKIPDFERERIEGDNHSNPAFGGISRIGHLDSTQKPGPQFNELGSEPYFKRRDWA